MSDPFKAEDYRELHARLKAAADDDVTAILSNNFNVVLGALGVANDAGDWTAEDLKELHRMFPDLNVCTHNPVSQVYFRAGLLAAREYMARFVEPMHPEIANSIRQNWWPSLSADPGPPRQLAYDEIAEELPTGRIEHRDMSPSVEALPYAYNFLLATRP